MKTTVPGPVAHFTALKLPLESMPSVGYFFSSRFCKHVFQETRMESIFRVPKRTQKVGDPPPKSQGGVDKVVNKLNIALFLKSWKRIWYPRQNVSKNTKERDYFMFFGVLFGQLFTGLGKHTLLLFEKCTF